MHIAIVRTEFIAARGGAERYAVNLARRWANQGHRISVVCHKADEADAWGMEVVKVSRPKILGPLKHRWFAARAGKAARDTGAEAVLCLARAFPGDVLRLGDGLHRVWMDERYRSAATRKLAELNPRHRQLLKLEAELFKPGQFKQYVANSEMIRDLVVKLYGVKAASISVIPNGVDFGRFSLDVRLRRDEMRRQLKLDADARVILFAGMDLRRKGLMEVARGFRELLLVGAGPKPVLLCVGKGETEAAQELLRAEDLYDQAAFYPATSDMAGFYAAADVFVLPSMHDPSANAVTEALACGLPVITSRQNGAAQHIKDGVNGWVLENRRDAPEFAARVHDLFENRRDPTEVVKASNLINMEENADRLLEVLAHAAKSRRKAAK